MIFTMGMKFFGNSFLLLFLLLAVVSLHGQDQQMENYYSKALKEFQAGKIEEALPDALLGLDLAESNGDQVYTSQFKYLLADIYRESDDYEKALEFLVQIVVAAEDSGDKRALARAYLLLGVSESAMNAYNKANASFVRAYAEYEALRDRTGQATVASEMGKNHTKEKNYIQAIESYSLVASLLRRRGRTPLIVNAYEGLLDAYNKTDNYVDGIPIALRFDNLMSGDPVTQAPAWGYLCKFYRLKGDLEASKDMGRRALVVFKENFDYNIYLGQTFLQEGSLNDARTSFTSALSIAQSRNDNKAITTAYRNLAKINFQKDELREGISNLAEAQRHARDSNDPSTLISVYDEYIDLYERQKNTAEANIYKSRRQQEQNKISTARNNRLAVIKSADEEANRIEQVERLKVTQQEKQQLASQREILQATQEQQQLALQQQQERLISTEQEKEFLELERQSQDEVISKQELEAEKRQSQIANLQENLSLTEEERKALAQEREILAQRATIQQQAIEASEQRRRLLSYIIVISAIGLATVMFLLIRMIKSNKVISHQNDRLESQKERLKVSQLKIKNTLKNEQKVRKALQKTHSHLKATQAQLVHAEKMSGLGQLTAGIAHEINNPIGFIKGGMQTLELAVEDLYRIIDDYETMENSDTTKLKAKLDEIRNNSNDILLDSKEVIKQLFEDIIFGADRVKEIVDGLRVFSRHDEADIKMANLHENLDSALLILKSKFAESAEILKEYDPKVGDIDCFPGQLNQVFVNLVSNAVDAMDEYGKIVVKTVDHGEEVEIRFIDNGRGIEKDKMTKIFEPFYTTKDVGEGTGLGLSISYSIIKQHNGSIDVESEVGKGSEFIIRLPKQLESEGNQPQAKSTLVEA